ncbi:hypothetical protein HN51_008648 [Arachis hypogaea]|uniref:Late embryogenesis abundant protein LEA-2 subgroup domain-containing protein n=1 Tax=Arachis hypogaea TaxID=3818 RepID=A0A445D2I4_ARAHY|nr:NDR1/HIN1-like protein 1 [Arachis hypogaea]QHO42987.1 uncharacterized protein DS421_5g158940 [Arachis hypogaea]RYR57439.1 hypothetical protein Ahy_A05g023171 [Arachis hypogaea]
MIRSNSNNMHANTDSDVTSYDPSTPRSPKRAVYYVQSPSRDSHDDGDKSSTNHATTPAYNSPTDSPSHHSYGHHSRESSASRVSGSYNSSWGRRWNRKRGSGYNKGWPEGKVIEEEGYYGDFHSGNEGLARRTQVFFAVVGFVVIFSVFCLIIWGASRPYKPKIIVKSLIVHNFNIGGGADLTGVLTKMLTVNCSFKMTVHNPATFFGIHVSSKSANLMYSEISVATGELKKYYQQRKSRRTVYMNMKGDKVPLYGAGASLSDSAVDRKIPMRLVFEVKSKGNVVGKLVKSKHRQQISCSVVLDSESSKPFILKENACSYS